MRSRTHSWLSSVPDSVVGFGLLLLAPTALRLMQPWSRLGEGAERSEFWLGAGSSRGCLLYICPEEVLRGIPSCGIRVRGAVIGIWSVYFVIVGG